MTQRIFEELPQRKFQGPATPPPASNDGESRENQPKDESSEKKIRQAVYDIRYRARREDIPLMTAFSQYMQNSSLSGPEQIAVKQKLAGKSSVTEGQEFDTFVADSVSNALRRVFVDKIPSFREEDIEELTPLFSEEIVKNSKGEVKYKVRVNDKNGTSYVRYATREKISQLRSNPQILSVELTDYGTPYEGEKGKKKLDPVGKEDSDVNNDGKVNNQDAYIKNRRTVISKEIAKEGYVIEASKTKKDKSNEPIDVMPPNKKNIININPIETELSNATHSESRGYYKFINDLQEAAVSKNQRRLAGQALAYLRGENPDASDEVKEMSKMGEAELRKFAGTPEKGLPEKVEENCDSTMSKDKDDRDKYAKRNLIKNRLRAATGIKDPIVIEAP